MKMNDEITKICNDFKIDKRTKPFMWNGELVRNVKVTLPCTGCCGGGCFECGGTGKRVNHFPDLLVSREQLNNKYGTK